MNHVGAACAGCAMAVIALFLCPRSNSPHKGFRATTTSDNAGPTSAKTATNTALDPLASQFLANGGVNSVEK